MKRMSASSLKYRGCHLLVLAALLLSSGRAEARRAQADAGSLQLPSGQPASTYVLGPGDEVSIFALEAEEITGRPYRIDAAGYINLPLVGRIRAAGLTILQLESEVGERLKVYVRHPEVTIHISVFRSQPVTVLGAVNRPGILQLEGRKTLVDLISMAGGLRQEAGYKVIISRRCESGPLPLPTAKPDATGEFTVAEINLKAVMEGRNPSENILILPNDAISVPRGDIVYVVGEVQKPGGFVMDDRESLSVLQALAMAGGVGPGAAPSNARILRPVPGAERAELKVNLKDVLSGKARDPILRADDILFVPTSQTKGTMRRVTEAAIQATTGLLIYRRY